MLKLSVCLQVNGKTVFWKCWKLFLKNFILLNSKLGDGQDDFSGLVSSFKLPHNKLIIPNKNTYRLKKFFVLLSGNFFFVNLRSIMRQ